MQTLICLRRRGQWASRGATGKSGLHASGEGERLIALEPWLGAGDQPRLIQGIRRRDGVGEDQETTA